MSDSYRSGEEYMSAELISKQTDKPGLSALDWINRIQWDVLLDYPIHASLFAMDFALLSFCKFPILLVLMMQFLLVYLSMFFSAIFVSNEVRSR